jgi:hypothetical protein
MLVQKDGKWAFVSRKTRRPLAYYRGDGKPSEEWVRKQEQRVQYFKHIGEATYVGNVGVTELVKFHSKATPQQKKQLQSHIQNKNHKEFRNLIKQVTGVELHKSVNEKQEFVSKAGAGEEGRPELVNKYKKDTPGQNVKSFKDYMKTK